MFKQTLAPAITSLQINDYYEKALSAGALGGKLLGAGGGGFLLLCVEMDRKDEVRSALSDLMEFPIEYEPYGSRIIFVR
jgi:D-glycero-alpha-D-manno-heptose-7-phosphate kinase